MPNDLLAGLDEIDFPELTGDRHTQNIAWLLHALAETARTPMAADYVSGLLKTELTKDHMVGSDATALAALFVARMAIHHSLPFVRTAALHLFEELELCDEDNEADLAHQVNHWALKDAYSTLRQAEPGEDVGSAIHLVAAIEGFSSIRLHKQMRRLELQTRNIVTREAIEAVRQQARS